MQRRLLELAQKFIREMEAIPASATPASNPRVYARQRGAPVVRAFVAAGLIEPGDLEGDPLSDVGVLMAACERLRVRLSSRADTTSKGEHMQQLLDCLFSPQVL